MSLYLVLYVRQGFIYNAGRISSHLAILRLVSTVAYYGSLPPVFLNPLSPTPFLQNLRTLCPKGTKASLVKVRRSQHKGEGQALWEELPDVQGQKGISHSELVSPTFCPKRSTEGCQSVL